MLWNPLTTAFGVDTSQDGGTLHLSSHHYEGTYEKYVGRISDCYGRKWSDLVRNLL